jgi:hypothetical protein
MGFAENCRRVRGEEFSVRPAAIRMVAAAGRPEISRKG